MIFQTPNHTVNTNLTIMNYRYISCLLVLFLFPLLLLAQGKRTSSKGSTGNQESYILTDISYINDAVFMGRRDSIAAPYIFPSLGYYDKSGFFMDASASYLIGSEESRFDLFLTTLGYRFLGEKISGEISGTAYFFNDDSYNVKSSVLADISGFIGYDLKVMEISFMASTYFNEDSSTDLFAGLLVDRVFYSNDKNLLINPTVSIYAGSQYFYEEYYGSSRLGNRKGQSQGQGQGGLTSNGATTVEIQEASKFKILNVELSLPLQYHQEQFIFSFTPVLAFPQSSATITTEDSVFTEDLESTFYFSVGIGYWFYTKKATLR